MMPLPKKCIVIKSLCIWLVALGATTAIAGTAIGTVTQVSGPLLLKRADGAIKAITLNSFVEQGDTLVTEKNTYAQLKFADDSEVTLKPGTQLKIETLVFNAGAASNMDTVFSLTQGAVQIRTGAAARATPENIRLVTPSLLSPTASLVLDRKAGSTFVAEYVAGTTETKFARFDSQQLKARYPAMLLASAESAYRSDAPSLSLPKNWDAAQVLSQLTLPPPSGARAPGLYVQVLDGLIHVTNPAGAQNLTAGQFGFTPSFQQPPVILPNNPGIQFTPPPSFSSTTGTQSGTQSGKPGDVDCVVR